MAKDRSGINYWKNLAAPTQNELSYILDQYVQLGVLAPEDVDTIVQDPSTLESFLEDPETTASQIKSLKELETLGEGKLTDTDRANMMQQMQMEAQQERANREAILSNARSRGVAGSGLEMAAQLQSQQDAANRASRAGVDVNVAAQQRALQALGQAGSLAGQMRGQDLDVAQRKAAATDAINQFNTQNRQNVEKQNVDTRNKAQAANLAERQRIAEANVKQTNEQRRIASDARQQQFENELAKTQGIGAAYAENERIRKGVDDAKKQQQGQNAQTAATVVAAMFSDERVKKDVKPVNMSEILDKIAPVKFKYKDMMEQYGEDTSKDHVGVMAQDVEKGMPELVSEVDGIKTIDIKESVPMLLAALSDINTRMKKLEKK